MFGNDIFGMMGIVIVRTVWGSSVVHCLPVFEKKNAHIILERNKALLRESVGVVIKVAVL